MRIQPEAMATIFQAAGPTIGDGRGWGEDDGAAQIGFLRDGGGAQIAEIDAERTIGFADRQVGTVQVNRRVIAGGAEFGDQALAFAERVAADDMGALREHGLGGQETGDLGLRVGVVEDRQAERGFGDEDVAGGGFEWGAGRVRLALVVAGDDGAGAGVLQHNLSRAQYVAGGDEGDGDAVDVNRLVVGQILLRVPCPLRAHAGAHNGEGVRRGQHIGVAGAGMVSMGVGDDGAVHRANGVDIKIPRFAKKAVGAGFQPGLGMRRRH
jgi:hypothetical protein